MRPGELEEVPMPIVGGLDIHRKQITFDYLDTATGEVRRGRSPRPTGRTCAPGWPGSPAGTMPRSRWRAVPAGGTSRRSWPRPASRRMSPSRPAPPSPAAASGTPRPTRPTPGIFGCCGAGPAAGVLDPASADPGVPGAAGGLPRPAPRAHRPGAAACGVPELCRSPDLQR